MVEGIRKRALFIGLLLAPSVIAVTFLMSGDSNLPVDDNHSGVAHASTLTAGLNIDCAECHIDPITVSSSADCLGCHVPPTTVGTNNNINFPHHDPAEGFDCQSCHAGSDARYVEPAPTPDHAFCKTCHSPGHGTPT